MLQKQTHSAKVTVSKSYGIEKRHKSYGYGLSLETVTTVTPEPEQIFDFEAQATLHENGWINFAVRVKNWIPPAGALRRPKECFWLGYHPGERRWARSKDYHTAMHHPELLDQILAWHEVQA